MSILPKKTVIIAVLANVFILFWAYMFGTSLYAGQCYKDGVTPEKRLEICTRSLSLNGVFLTDWQQASNSFAQAVALADLGEASRSVTMFSASWDQAKPFLRGKDQKEKVQHFLRDMTYRLTLTPAAKSALSTVLKSCTTPSG
ncbi:hypothetical protein [Pacificibacter marinus]|uniref:Uncharacterized protein n=1 Tax=Pacificibacter marinus TaxID=658057 RepID=A0A1Y5SPP7_9RHOB|nr:hypothetical protein [Pacificibacter marinus]SEK69278.1 hypothetical protein SAMN04488032_105129 [Pacificibacter marinus]SLN45471.1 hypothetical protein PAM7971_02196 [Pacificibacter marinus]